MEGEGNGSRDEYFSLYFTKDNKFGTDDLGRPLASYMITTKG